MSEAHITSSQKRLERGKRVESNLSLVSYKCGLPDVDRLIELGLPILCYLSHYDSKCSQCIMNILKKHQEIPIAHELCNFNWHQEQVTFLKRANSYECNLHAYQKMATIEEGSSSFSPPMFEGNILIGRTR